MLCTTVLVSSQSNIRVIPKPSKIEAGQGNFHLDRKTVIAFSSENLREAAQQCSSGFALRTGLQIPVRPIGTGKIPRHAVILSLGPGDSEIGTEGYRLSVTPAGILIRASGEAGVFYGIQTLFQLVPLETTAQAKSFPIPCVRIEDKPRFSWRGLHLDVSRHFFPISFIKTWLDVMALHKMNTFHWHLTDDQGWRIEIKKYPKLTEVGAWRVDREDRNWNDREPQKDGETASYGGFYTQDQIRDIVDYAARLHITVVPEIEMPAHSTAAMAAYPQYSCTGGPFTVPPGGLWPLADIFCAGNDSVFAFLEDILSEVVDLFPSPFVHIGGDEADKTKWAACPKCQARIRENGLKDVGELQSYFVKRIESILIARNRRLIGWDEILEGGLAPQATVMSWRGMDGGIAAARENHDVVMTPTSHCYFDYYQGNPEYEPLAIGGFTPLNQVYSFEPVPDSLTAEQAGHILGAQANVWTEYIATPEHALYMTLPRLAALSEAVWSPRESRNLDEFGGRVENLLAHYRAMNYTYAPSGHRVSISTRLDSAAKTFSVSLSTDIPVPAIRYTTSGCDPDSASPIFKDSLRIDKTTVIAAAPFSGSTRLAGPVRKEVMIHKALLCPVTLRNPYTRYSGGGRFALTDGTRGTLAYGDGSWQGYQEDNLDAVVDLGDTSVVRRLAIRTLENTPSWIFHPVWVEFSVSCDGINFTPVGRIERPMASGHQPFTALEWDLTIRQTPARYVRVVAENVGLCPPWHGGRGKPAWLFADEIVVE